MRMMVAPWVRDAMTPDEWERLSLLQGEANGAVLSLIAKSPGGPFTGRLNIPGLNEIRHDEATLDRLLARLLASVEALT